MDEATGEVDQVLNHFPENINFKTWNDDPKTIDLYEVSWTGLDPKTGKCWPHSKERRKDVDKLSVAQYWYNYLLKHKPNSSHVNKLIKLTSTDQPPEIEYVYVDHVKIKGFQRDGMGRAGFDLKNTRTQTNYFLPITALQDTSDLQVKLDEKLKAFMGS